MVYTSNMTTVGSEPHYNPYTKEQFEKIKYWWDIYRNSVGLEGELYITLKKSGMGEDKVAEEIREYRKRVAKDRENWNNLRQER